MSHAVAPQAWRKDPARLPLHYRHPSADKHASLFAVRPTRGTTGELRNFARASELAQQNAPGGSRARGTSMGGLFVAATLQAPLWKRP